MALDFRGRTSHQGPPPSTLAAKLVDHIPTSTRTSRPDEAQELKKLLSVIQKIKNEPQLFKTAEERIEHNHLLIYVVTLVKLERLKWDDPFADRAVQVTEALEALNFVQYVITETPDVLRCTTDGQKYILRGQEPLWLWILPKVLTMLGHQCCLALALPVQSFCRFILLCAGRPGSLSTEIVPIVRYLQGNVNGSSPPTPFG